MPGDIRRNVRTHVEDLTLSRVRSAKIDEVVSNGWNEHGEKAYHRAVHHAITQMGPWDSLKDRAAGEVKRQLLEAIARLSLCNMTVPLNRAQVIQNEEERLQAFATLFALLSPDGRRAILANPEPTAKGIHFRPDSTSERMEGLLAITLPYLTAGDYLVRAGKTEDAAQAYERAAESALQDGEPNLASRLLRKVAKLWSQVPGAELDARQALLKYIEVCRMIGRCEKKKGDYAVAAVAFSRMAKAYQRVFDYKGEAESWGVAESAWREAAERIWAAAGDDREQVEAARQCRTFAGKAELRKWKAEKMACNGTTGPAQSSRQSDLSSKNISVALTPDTRA